MRHFNEEFTGIGIADLFISLASVVKSCNDPIVSVHGYYISSWKYVHQADYYVVQGKDPEKLYIKQ